MKLSLDLAIGETNAINTGDTAKLGELAQKIKDLNGRLVDIRREQMFQRVSWFLPASDESLGVSHLESGY